MSKIIEIIVSPKGETKVETKGFAGEECRDASRAIEAALGQRSAERLTTEFYLRPEQQNRLQEGT